MAKGACLLCLEQFWIEVVSLQQFIEFGPVSLREFGSLCHITARDSEQLREVLAFEFASGRFERDQFASAPAERALHQGRRNDRSGGQCNRLFNDIVQFANITRPRRFDRLDQISRVDSGRTRTGQRPRDVCSGVGRLARTSRTAYRVTSWLAGIFRTSC